MKNKIIFAILCGFIITSCNSKKENSEAEHNEENKFSIIELTVEQFKTVGIEPGTIEQKNLKSVVKASGYLEVPPQNKASVSTFIGAVVKSISVLEGNFVKQGQTLAVLEHPDFIKLQEAYLTEKNNFSFVEKEYLRQKELMEQNSGTGKVFQKAESDYNISKGKISSLESQLKMLSVNLTELSKGNITSSIILTSPIEGYVGHINANIGAYAEPNKTLFEITDNTKIHCDLLVYEKDLFKVKVGQKVNFILANQPEHQEEHNSETIEGEIFGINKSFENDTKALIVHASIKNEHHELIPGIYVNGIIDVGEQTSLAVPVDAIVKADGKEWIFIVSEMHTATEHEHSEKEDKDIKEELGDIYIFKMVEVITGVSDLGFIEITPIERIADNAKVVIKNPFFILSKAKEGEGGEE
ncbi:MAG: efflux RND transporter periplasmic adaptor subunit [Bacteroidetes bacterium]|nr:MAG: efflux RND transporter periplasmic adaptor subunit [Bacteroidota bacterium]